MNPVTVIIFDINQYKVVTEFLDTCLSKASIAAVIFASAFVFQLNKIPWQKCLSLGVDNISVNGGKSKSINVEVRKKK